MAVAGGSVSLAPIVRALGGDLYDRGRRAIVPGPGHGPRDRSVSLLMSDGRLVVHSFGRSSWREVFDDLRRRDLVDAAGRPHTGAHADRRWSPPPPSHLQRTAVALELWREAEPIGRQLSAVHIRGRGVHRPIPISDALRHHRAVPACVYAAKGPSRPALLAAVTSADGEFCAVEVTYLAPGGGRALGVRTSRKVIGVLPAGCAVRLDAACEELVVGEGVFSTLSAADRFSQPGWALLSAHNLRAWIPPVGVRRVVIAGDRGVEGERSARFLRRRLRSPELSASIAWPPVGAGDWNEA